MSRHGREFWAVIDTVVNRAQQRADLSFAGMAIKFFQMPRGLARKLQARFASFDDPKLTQLTTLSSTPINALRKRAHWPLD
jgi:hypothetical protein